MKRLAIVLLCLSALFFIYRRMALPAHHAAGDQAIQNRALANATMLQGERISDPGALRRPSYVRLLGGRLYVRDDEDTLAIHVLDPRTGAALGMFGTHGTPDADFEALWTLEAADTSGRIWAYDLVRRRLTLIDVASSMKSHRVELTRSLTLAGSGTTTGPVRLTSDQIVSPGFYTDGRMTLFDSLGVARALLGHVTEADTMIPGNVLNHAFQSTAVANRERALIALATRYADRVEFYDSTGTLRYQIDRPLQFDPAYSVARDRNGVRRFASSSDTRLGFIDAVGTTRALYVLFSGRRSHAVAKRPYGRVVYRFDWNGARTGTFGLDQDALSIAVDSEDKALFAVAPVGDKRVSRYALPPATR